MYKYIPNDFAKKKFGLKEEEYSCGSLTILLEKALGKENCDKYLFAQDPFSNKRTSRAEIKIIINREKLSHQKPRLASIGIVIKD